LKPNVDIEPYVIDIVISKFRSYLASFICSSRVQTIKTFPFFKNTYFRFVKGGLLLTMIKLHIHLYFIATEK